MHRGERGVEHDKQALGCSTSNTPMHAACHCVCALAHVLQCAVCSVQCAERDDKQDTLPNCMSLCVYAQFFYIIRQRDKQPVCSVQCAVCSVQCLRCALQCDVHSVLTRAAVLGLHRLLCSEKLNRELAADTHRQHSLHL